MNNTNNETNYNRTSGEDFRPKFAIYHPNGKGTGCALKLDLHPAHGDHDGCIMMSMAPQKTIGENHGANKRFPTFDWEHRICVKLDFADLCKMLQVFRGEVETLEDGKGLYHRSARYTTRIVFRHILEPVHGYSLEVYRDAIGKTEESCAAHIVLNPWEALGISISFENSIGLICFGIPKVMAHAQPDDNGDGTAYDLPA